MSDDVRIGIALGLWYALALVAVHYAYEWYKARKAGSLLPPHKHPGLLLLAAAQMLYRLWPLTLLFAVSWAMGGATGRGPLREAHWASLPFLIWTYAHTEALRPHWIVNSVIVETFRSGIAQVGPLVLAAALGSSVWIVLANPWHLGRGIRIAAALGALAVVFALVVRQWTSYESTADLGYRLAWAEAFSRRVVNDLVSALLVAALWHFGVNRSRDLAGMAPKAYACFLVALVVTVVMQIPMWLIWMASAVGGFDPVYREAVSSFYTGWLWRPMVLLMIWAPWVAASTGPGPISCIRAGVTLVVRHPLDFLLLVGRVAVVAMPLHFYWVAEQPFQHLGAVAYLTDAISVTLAVWLVATTGLAYASLTDQFPSAAPQAGEEALPPNLPGDITIAH